MIVFQCIILLISNTTKSFFIFLAKQKKIHTGPTVDTALTRHLAGVDSGRKGGEDSRWAGRQVG